MCEERKRSCHQIVALIKDIYYSLTFISYLYWMQQWESCFLFFSNKSCWHQNSLQYSSIISLTNFIASTPWQAYFGLGKLDFGLGKLDFWLGNPILDFNPILDLATKSWTKIPLIRIYQFKFAVSIIALNYTF